MPAYMHFPGIDGDAKGIHYRWIELLSVTLPQNKDKHAIVCTKYQDSASAKLQQKAIYGDPVDVDIHFTKGLQPGEMTYLRITLKGVLVSGWSLSGSVSGNNVTETVTLNYTDMTFNSTPDSD